MREAIVGHGKRAADDGEWIVIVNPVCLTCHGRPEDLAPEVRARLQALYPRDQATGYRLGDVRGAVSVKVPISGER